MSFKDQKSLIVRFALIFVLLGGISGALSISLAHAAALTVTNTNDSGAGSLRQAVMDAAPGDTINFDPSLAGQTISLTSQINLDKDLIIDGSSLNPAVEISGSLSTPIFYVSSNSTATLQSLLLKDGRSNSASGGAIYSDGNLIVSNSTFINNAATNNGGAIFSRLALNIDNSTFVSNSAYSGGAIYIEGGIFTNPNSSRSIVNSTFVSNQANAANGRGGGVFNYGSGSEIDNVLVLTNNTFSGNGAYEGGGLYTWGSLVFSNNIFANSTSGGDCVSDVFGGTVTASNNFIEDGTPCSMGNFLSGDPLLDSLSDNGGSTLTMALLPGSPAIDAGTTICLPTDQRGVTRPQGSHCDIGAYEYVFPLTPTSTSTLTFTPTFTPTNPPTATQTSTPMPTNTFTPTATPPYSYQPLYLSFASSQTIGGVASDDEDILSFDGHNWMVVFDGSDVGVNSTNLAAFSFVDTDTILMSFDDAVTANGLAITPQDVVYFNATSLGSTTSGTFSMLLDGSKMGLDTNAEKIDSVGLSPDRLILISTTGDPSVPGVEGKDEDVLVFTPILLDGYGEIINGTWAMYFDGSDVGLAENSNEDIDALDVIDNKIYLSTLGKFSVNGVSGMDEDVFVCEARSLGDVTDCHYSSELYFDGSTWGLTANNVDAFNFLPPPYVATPPPAITLVP